MSDPIIVILLAFTISMLVAFFILPQILLISFKKHLFDIPNSRTVHKNIVPRLGGISFFPSIILSIFISIFFYSYQDAGVIDYYHMFPQILLGVCALIIIYFIGVADDFITLRYREKFVAQILAGICIISSGLYFRDLHGILGINAIPVWLGMPLTLFFLVYITNAINLIDGIDGLSSGLCAIALLSFGVIFFTQGNIFYAILSIATLGAIVPFFYYNTYSHRKLFMGDTGTYTLGLIIAILILSLSAFPAFNGQSKSYSLLIALSFIAIPILDMARVILYRMRKKVHLFLPDKNHIHHRLLELGYTHRKSRNILFLLAISIILVNLALYSLININLLLIIDIIYYSVFNIIISNKIKNKK